VQALSSAGDLVIPSRKAEMHPRIEWQRYKIDRNSVHVLTRLTRSGPQRTKDDWTPSDMQADMPDPTGRVRRHTGGHWPSDCRRQAVETGGWPYAYASSVEARSRQKRWYRSRLPFFWKVPALGRNPQTEVRLGAHSVRWREENSVEQFALQATDVSVPGWK
jgi:hypothetical protein